MLDPYFNVRDDAVQWPGALVRTMVNDTKASIAYEMIKISNVLNVPVLGPLFTGENLELTRSIGETVFKPDFVAVRATPLATFINRTNADDGSVMTIPNKTGSPLIVGATLPTWRQPWKVSCASVVNHV